MEFSLTEIGVFTSILATASLIGLRLIALGRKVERIEALAEAVEKVEERVAHLERKSNVIVEMRADIKHLGADVAEIKETLNKIILQNR